jgi:hypothetical protein
MPRVLLSLLLCRLVTSLSLLRLLLLLSEVGGEDVDHVDAGVDREVDADAVVVQGASDRERGVASLAGQIIPEVS